jgi:hypothetical protein
LQRKETKKEEFEEEERKRREEQKATSAPKEKIEGKEVSKEEKESKTFTEEALTIPMLKLEKPSLEAYKLELNYKTPSVEKEEIATSIPFIVLEKKPSVVVEQKFIDKFVFVNNVENFLTVQIL